MKRKQVTEIDGKESHTTPGSRQQEPTIFNNTDNYNNNAKTVG